VQFQDGTLKSSLAQAIKPFRQKKIFPSGRERGFQLSHPKKRQTNSWAKKKRGHFCGTWEVAIPR